MKAEFRITEDDYAKGMQLHAWRRVLRWPSGIIIRAIILIVLILSAWWLPSEARDIVIACVVVLAILPVGLLYIVIPYTARRMYRKYKAIQEPMTVELSDDGLRFGSATGEVIVPWRMIFQWCQNNQFVLIYKMPVLFYVVPKSVAQQGFDIPLLVQRLAERVGKER